MPSDQDTVITPAQLKAGHRRSEQAKAALKKLADHGAAHRTEVVSTIWPEPACEVCSLPIRTAGEAVLVRVGDGFPGVLEPRHRSCDVAGPQPARSGGGSAT